MENIKKISKYILNTLTIINALLIGIAPIWGLDVEQICETIAVIMAVISTYLLGNKAYTKINEEDVSTEEEL